MKIDARVSDRAQWLWTAAAMVVAACGTPPSEAPGDPVAALTAAVQDEVTPEGLSEQVDSIVQHERLSGSPGENAAIDHIVRVLESEGVAVTVDTFMAWVSDPISARVQVVGTDFAPEAITVSGSASVEGLEGAVADLGSADDLPPFLTSTGENLVLAEEGPGGSGGRPDRPDVRGRIALVIGTPGPDEVAKLTLLGAVGAVFVNTEERLTDMTVNTVWGSPSLRDYHRIPTLPVAEVRKSDGDRIRAMLGSGQVRIRMSVETRTGWKPLRLAVARIPGPTPDAPYILLGGHLDAWYHGGTDNGGANVAMLEVARAFNRQKSQMRRGLVVAWWPGHSNGRYAGSTWFVDHNFDELRHHALAYVNFEGMGQMGAKRFSASTTASLSALARAVVREGVGDSIRTGYPGRSSDQSFYGVGLPLLEIDHSRLSEDGGYWWWHTPDDTRDKVDPEVLKTDTDLYAAAIARMVAAPNFPVDLAAVVERLGSILAERQEAAGARFDLSEPLARQQGLLRVVREVEASLPAEGDAEVDLARVAILRPLHRVLYTQLGPYHPDPASSQGSLPGLNAVEILASEDPGSDGYHFAETTLLREKARLLEALDQATAAAERLRDRLWSR